MHTRWCSKNDFGNVLRYLILLGHQCAIQKWMICHNHGDASAFSCWRYPWVAGAKDWVFQEKHNTGRRGKFTCMSALQCAAWELFTALFHCQSLHFILECIVDHEKQNLDTDIHIYMVVFLWACSYEIRIIFLHSLNGIWAPSLVIVTPKDTHQCCLQIYTRFLGTFLQFRCARIVPTDVKTKVCFPRHQLACKDRWVGWEVFIVEIQIWV